MIKSEAIVLSSIPYRSSSVIVRILCPWGKVSAIYKGVGSKSSTVCRSEIQSGTMLSLELIAPAQTSELYTIKECSLNPSQTRSTLSPMQNSELTLMCELTSISIEHSQADPLLYNFMEQCIGSVVANDLDYVSCRFAFGLACCLGFAPSKYQSGYFDMQQGTFSPIKPFHPYYLSPNNAELFYSLTDSEQPLSLPSSEQYLKLWHIITTYFWLHVSGFKEPRSLDFLKELTIIENF